MTRRFLYCCGCEGEIHPRLTTGAEIYPHREDLAKLQFWKCDRCGNYVGAHRGGRRSSQPLGSIPTPELRAIRSEIHAVIDPAWRSKESKRTRSQVYDLLSKAVGYRFHAAETRTVEEAARVLGIAKEIFQ